MGSERKGALITGASAGLGEAFARLLAAEGHDLMLVARRADRLRQLGDELAASHGVRVLVCPTDLSQPGAAAFLQAQAEAEDFQVDILINNAGLAEPVSFLNYPVDDVRAMIEVMITGLTELTHRFGQGMVARGWGRILNVSSLAAFAPNSPGMLYTGIKSYVLNMSQALDMQFKPAGVHVTALCPGFTWTEFHDTQGTREWANRLPAFAWQDADTVVKAGWGAVSRGEPVCIPGVVNKAVASFTRHLPERLRYLFGKQARMVH
ncbi:MAG: SDR family oxidoreductase [Perlucidibaca sp.]